MSLKVNTVADYRGIGRVKPVLRFPLMACNSMLLLRDSTTSKPFASAGLRVFEYKKGRKIEFSGQVQG